MKQKSEDDVVIELLIGFSEEVTGSVSPNNNAFNKAIKVYLFCKQRV